MNRAAGPVLAILLSACLTVSSGGPDDDRQERIEFVPAPATAEEFRSAIADSVGPDFEPVDGSFEGIGKYPGPQGPLVYGRFDAIDESTGEVLECTGFAAPFQSAIGCGQGGGDVVEGAIDIASTGSTDVWAEAEFSVTDEVAEIAVVADDGTAYRVVPIGNFAWMEWRVERGDVVASALSASNEVLEVVEVDVGPE